MQVLHPLILPSSPVTATSYIAGSSTYGATSTTVNGPITCSGWTIGLNGGNSALTFPSGLQGVFYCGATPVALLTPSGNFQCTTLQANTLNAGSSTYGSTSATVAGSLAFTGGTFSASTAFTIVPASTSGYTFRNNANSTSPMIVTDGGALTLLGAATKPGGGLWTATSDVRVKQDITPHTDGLATIRKLHPIAFRYNGKGGVIADGKLYVGLSAQDVQEIAPRIVSSSRAKLDLDDEDEVDLLHVDSSELIYTLINAVQELSAQVEQLKPRRKKVNKAFIT